MIRHLLSLVIGLSLILPTVPVSAAPIVGTPLADGAACRADRIVLNEGSSGAVAVYDIEHAALDAVSPMWLRSGVSAFPSSVPGRAVILNSNRDIAAIDLNEIDNPTLFLYPGPIYQVGEVTLVDVPLDSPWVSVASQGEGVVEIDLISMLDDSIFETRAVVGEGILVERVLVAPGSERMIIGTLEQYFLGVPGDANSFRYQFEPLASDVEFSPDGNLLAFQQGRFDASILRVIDPATTEVVLDRPLESPTNWAFLDATRVAIVEPGRITIIDLSTAAESSFALDANMARIEQVSPDGTSLLFNRQYHAEFDRQQNTFVAISPEWGVLDLTTGDVTTPQAIQGREFLGGGSSNWWIFGNVVESGTPATVHTATSAGLLSYDVTKGTATAILEGGAHDSVELLDRSTDGQYLAGNVGHSGAYQVELVDLSAGNTTILDQASDPRRVLISPSGCMVAVGPVPAESAKTSGGSIDIFRIDGSYVAQIAEAEFVGWVTGL